MHYCLISRIYHLYIISTDCIIAWYTYFVKYIYTQFIPSLRGRGLLANSVKRCQEKYNVYDIYLDNAETTLIKGLETELTKQKIPINVHKARKSEIVGRIRFTNIIMSQNRFALTPDCKHLTEAMQSAVWDSKQQKDVRLDDGNYNIDSLDAFEYSVEKYMKQIIEIGGLSD